VTFLFTDVVGSTRLWADHHVAMAQDLTVHDEVVRAAIEDHGGYVFSTGGDAFVAAFTRPGDAVAAATRAQRGLDARDWSLPEGIQVRMGIHTGSATERGGDYFGPTLNETARLMSAAHGGQIVLSARTQDLSPEVEVVSLGVHRFRDLRDAMEVFQVVADGLVSSFPALRSLGTGLSTLPEHRSAFVGRRADIDRVRSSLGEHRLVTLTGVGGVGKTRLAVEAADEELPKHPGGVFFVDLSPVAEPDAVLAAVRTGIGLSPSDPVLHLAELIDFLHERTALLVIDNCEHLLDPVADLVDELLGQAPRVRVLATSREALDVDGEVVIRVPSLDAGGDAVRLFVDRAMASSDRFDPAVETETIRELCSRLDGIPLAIELAATATSTLSPLELLAALDDRFALLHGGRRRRSLGRQRTLEATIDWSHELLDDEERTAFRRLGIFAGPFIFDLVPTVLGQPPHQARSVLERLVAKSLVVPFRIDHERTGFRLLETLRVYAAGKLADAGERAQTEEAGTEAILQWIQDSWTEATRGDWTFWRCWRALIPDVQRVAELLLDAERIDELVLLLGTSVNGSGNAAWDEERLRLLERLDRDHLDELAPAVQTDLVGSLTLAQMNAAVNPGWIERSTSAWAEYRGLPITDKLLLFASQMTLLSLFDPEAGIREVDKALGDLGTAGSEDVWRRYALYLQSMCLASLGDFARATELAEQSFIPQDSELRDFALTTWLWYGHLAGSDIDAEPIALARSADPRDGYWRQAVCIAGALHAGTEPAIARDLVSVSDRGWNGMLLGEEGEYLTAFARLAYLRGDTDRARELLAAIPPRSPWIVAAIVATLASIDHWPQHEWSNRLIELVVDRSAPGRMHQLTTTMGPLLTEELERWR